MAKSKKYVKRKKKNPPLSEQDKFIYGCIETIGVIILLASVDIYKIFTHLIVFKKADVLAFEERWSVLLIVPFIIFLLFLVLKPTWKKLPIIGNKKLIILTGLNLKLFSRCLMTDTKIMKNI